MKPGQRTAPAKSTVESKPHLVVFDQAVARRSPAGSCVLAECEGLADVRRITVISNRCETDHPNVAWIRVPLPRGPLLLRYITFQWLAPFFLKRAGVNAPTVIQATQGQYVGADICYAHFCHRAYLRGAWRLSKVSGLRRLARWCNHQLNARWERNAFARARAIVVPSQGLARELSDTYPSTSAKISVIANPVDLAHYQPTPEFDRQHMRHRHGIGDGDIVLAFVALGDFARKGLPLVMEALAALDPAGREAFKILVVGGQPGEISGFEADAKAKGIASQVIFAGMQADVRPFLWAADIFAFPSAYEIFSLAILQAAAAGLPLLVSEGLYGAEEFVQHGVNGWTVRRDEASIRRQLGDIVANRGALPKLGAAARAAVQQYSQTAFVERWRALHDSLATP